MISRIFIERPRLAVVVSLVIVLAGLLALLNIPVAQYPSRITPPDIRVSATYPGASAEEVAALGGRPHRGRSQRRGRHDLPVLDLHQQRGATIFRSPSRWAPTRTWPRST